VTSSIGRREFKTYYNYYPTAIRMAQEAFLLTPAAGTPGQLTATQWREALLQNISLRCPFFIKNCQAGTTPPSPTTIVLSKPPEISDMTQSY
jgi:hypothetical protein